MMDLQLKYIYFWFFVFFYNTKKKNLLHRYLTGEGLDVNFNSAVNSTTSVE